jgi:DNA-directed RNA polymerase subunit RPC12/RpoP
MLISTLSLKQKKYDMFKKFQILFRHCGREIEKIKKNATSRGLYCGSDVLEKNDVKIYKIWEGIF